MVSCIQNLGCVFVARRLLRALRSHRIKHQAKEEEPSVVDYNPDSSLRVDKDNHTVRVGEDGMATSIDVGRKEASLGTRTIRRLRRRSIPLLNRDWREWDVRTLI